MSAPSPVASAVDDRAAPRSGRIAAIDWLRGLAVILMMLAHASDAWLADDARVGVTWESVRFLSGLPSRLFLFLVGVSAAIKLESQMARGTPAATMRAGLAKRGAQIVVLAYVFRLQEHLLAGFHGGWAMLFRVDILNCIGASMLVIAAFCVPTGRRPAIVRATLVLALLVGLGPIIGPAEFPAWLPRPLTSYVGGQRPMAWFTLFPFGCWAIAGLLAGHWWVRAARAGHEARALLGSGVIGAGFVVATHLGRALAPSLVSYPSWMAQQMGYGSFFLRLGTIGIGAALSYLAVRWARPGQFSPVRQLGQTSLLIYWVHIELCYGGLVWPLRKRLDFPQVAAGLALLIFLMLGLSVFRTRKWPSLAPKLAGWVRLTRPTAEANLRRP